MPLKAAAPVVVQALTADTFEITRCDIDARNMTISVTWIESLAQVYVRSVTQVIPGSVLGSTRPDGTKSWYQNIKNLLYSQLQALGSLPPGTLT